MNGLLCIYPGISTLFNMTNANAFNFKSDENLLINWIMENQYKLKYHFLFIIFLFYYFVDPLFIDLN